MIEKDKYKKALEEAQRDLQMMRSKRANLLDERETIDDHLQDTDKEIKQLQETIESLARLCNIELPRGLLAQRLLLDPRFGLTDAVRQLLKKASSALTAIEVRDALVAGGFDASEYSNLLASVHTTLKRLVQSGELLPVDKDGKSAHKVNPEYISPIMRRMASGEGLLGQPKGSGLLGDRLDQIRADIPKRMVSKEKK
jgi:hypothetical protein